jgi:hypothetical protein
VYEEPKSHDTPIVLVIRASDRSPGDLDINVYTRHGWTVGRQLVEALKQDGVEVQLTGFANDVTHTIVTLVTAAGGLAGAAAALTAFFQAAQASEDHGTNKQRRGRGRGLLDQDTEQLLKEALDQGRQLDGPDDGATDAGSPLPS